MADTFRSPCPWRIIEDCGGAFTMGVLCSGIYQFGKGVYNFPRGRKFVGALQTVRSTAPIRGGQFAAWGVMFSTFDCLLVYTRQKEDFMNTILAGSLAGGALVCRRGGAVMLTSFIVSGIIMAVMEGAGHLVSRKFAEAYRPVRPMISEEQTSSHA